MGCGQSKIHLYPRKSKSKANGKKKQIQIDTDTEEEERNNVPEDDNEKDNRIEEETLSDGKGSPEPINGDISVSLMRTKNLSLLQSQEISSSQQNFFRMMDQKIEDGPDYDSSSETEMALEEARLNALVQHWESASLPASLCSSTSRSLQSTPVRQVQIRQPTPLRAQLQQNAVDMMTQQQMHQQQQHIRPNLSPKRDVRNTMLTQSAIHQSYGVAQQQQQQLSSAVGGGMVGGMAGGMPGGMPIQNQRQRGNILPQHLSTAYYSPQPSQSYFGEVLHPLQHQQPILAEQQQHQQPRFPPAISVQRLAPQVQRQIRETQELIKDSCPQLYAAGYGSPGPPMRSHPQQRGIGGPGGGPGGGVANVSGAPANAGRRTTLETQYSQELS